jgi:hypothetical protein
MSDCMCLILNAICVFQLVFVQGQLITSIGVYWHLVIKYLQLFSNNIIHLSSTIIEIEW